MVKRRCATLILAVFLAACQTAPQLSPATRLKDYEKEVTTRMQATWLGLARERVDSLSVGTARVLFKVSSEGHVSELKVVSNSGNQSLATVALLTVQRTVLPPIPRAALAELPQGNMPGDCTFTVYQRR